MFTPSDSFESRLASLSCVVAKSLAVHAVKCVSMSRGKIQYWAPGEFHSEVLAAKGGVCGEALEFADRKTAPRWGGSTLTNRKKNLKCKAE